MGNRFKIGVLFALIISLLACKNRLKVLQGHWWVEEKNTGYLEFSVSNDTMRVCSTVYGTVYYGLIRVTKKELVSYKGFNRDSVRNAGKILYMANDSVVLQYKNEIIEVCGKLSDSIPAEEFGSCFAGMDSREREFYRKHQMEGN